MYNLNLPPRTPEQDDQNAALANHDQFASWPVPEQVQTIDGLTLDETRELLDRLDNLAQSHRERAGYLGSTAELVRQRLRDASEHNLAVAIAVPSPGRPIDTLRDGATVRG